MPKTEAYMYTSNIFLFAHFQIFKNRINFCIFLELKTLNKNMEKLQFMKEKKFTQNEQRKTISNRNKNVNTSEKRCLTTVTSD